MRTGAAAGSASGETGRREGLQPAEAFHLLLGEWTIEREVLGQAVMAGSACIWETGEGAAAYREQVVVTMADKVRFTGSQSYVVWRTSEGFELRFAGSGELFQDVRFRAGAEGELRGAAFHLCGEDQYASEYVLGPGRRFAVRHTVLGPRKRYVLETRYCGR